ncbi:MAG: apolipoprotein N-acyltransferase [Verrucomicrobia bacterium]|nr:apolipoprotein N-acyltransferase [Verrucomicrobiota bacterium]
MALALAFPLPGWAGLAWVAPALALAATAGLSGRRAWRLGWVTGFAFALVALRWLLHIPFPAGAVAGWLALSAYVALFIASWVWVMNRLLTRLLDRSEKEALRSGAASSEEAAVPGPREEAFVGDGPTAASAGTLDAERPAATADHSLNPVLHFGAVEPAAAVSGGREMASASPLRSWPERFARLGWAERNLWAALAGATWVALELAQGRLLSGFPWNFLGVSQYALTPLIQVAEVTGVYGVSFLVAWMSAALFCAGARLVARLTGDRAPGVFPGPSRPPAPAARPRPGLLVSFRLALFTDLALPLTTLLLVTFAGGLKLVRPAPSSAELRVALIQPSIPQRLIFDPDEADTRFQRLMELSRLAAATEPDLLVWPEASLPDFSEANYRALTDLVARHRLWMIFGADEAVPRNSAETGSGFDFYNSAFLLAPDGRLVASYRKRRLVIFGEYVPLADWLPFTKYLTPIQGSFSRGTAPETFRVGDRPVKIAPLICFEDVFPHGAREHVGTDTDLLLNLTNNGWFGESAAQWQHAVAAVFRAVENGVPLIRCTNNGLTCWIDERGRLREFGLGDPADIYGPGFTVYRLPLRAAGQSGPTTFYRQHGDVFGWTCVSLTLLALGITVWPAAPTGRSKAQT